MKLSRFNHFLKLDGEDACYAFNARTLAMAKLDGASFAAVNQWQERGGGSVDVDPAGLDEQTSEGLRAGGFLVADDEDELAELKARSHRTAT
jgi:hypothetical protein